MKVTLNFDCTPEEARRLVGLPDLSSIHAIYLDKMEKVATEGLTPEYFSEMMKSWGTMNEGGFALWKQMINQMSGKA